MKTLLALMISIACSLSMYATNSSPILTNPSESVVSRTVDASLVDEEYGQRLFLYADGSCVLRYADNSTVSGTYNIDGSKIRFNWEGGRRSQQGFCSFRNGQLEYVSVEGYTFKGRIVSQRRR